MSVTFLLLFFYKVCCDAIPEYDYIVVGSGTGGIVASRLAEAQNNVLLIEAGPDDLTYSCNMSSTCFSLPYGDLIAGIPLIPVHYYWFRGVDAFKWNATSMPSYWNYNKTILNFTEGIDRAKMLGGCLSHNGQVWTRGSARDYDFVADNLSLPTWSFDSVLPYFQRAETYFGDNNTLRGDKGPIQIRQRTINEWEYGLQSFLDAAIQSGYEYNNHQNGGYSQRGIGFSEMNTAKYENGTVGLFNTSYYRASSAQSYVRDIGLKSGYLTVWYSTTVQRILFDNTTSIPTAIGVEYYDDNNSLSRIYSKKEVILSAGVYQSPQILMLSGIGPSNELNKFNIKPIYINENIGRYGQDHSYLKVQYKYNVSSLNVTKERPTNQSSIKNIYNQTVYFDVLGVLDLFASSNTFDRLGYDYNDIRLQIGHNSNNQIIDVLIDSAVYSKNLTIQLNSLDARDFPNVYQNFFSDSRDYDIIIRGLDIVRKIFQMNPTVFVDEISPGIRYNESNMDELRKYIHSHGDNAIHAVGTVSMGPNKPYLNGSVYPVNSKCSLRGVSKLRIIDSSIWPYSTNSGDMALVHMIGEKCSQHIINDNNDQTKSDWWSQNTQYLITAAIIILCIVVLLCIISIYFCKKRHEKQRNTTMVDELTLLNAKQSHKM